MRGIDNCGVSGRICLLRRLLVRRGSLSVLVRVHARMIVEGLPPASCHSHFAEIHVLPTVRDAVVGSGEPSMFARDGLV